MLLHENCGNECCSNEQTEQHGFSCRDNYFFWSDVIGRTINRIRGDGTEREVLVDTNITVPGMVIVYSKTWNRQNSGLLLHCYYK